jgi:hypothetical protein
VLRECEPGSERRQRVVRRMTACQTPAAQKAKEMRQGCQNRYIQSCVGCQNHSLGECSERRVVALRFIVWIYFRTCVGSNVWASRIRNMVELSSELQCVWGLSESQFGLFS